jgi:hypothetical protein
VSLDEAPTVANRERELITRDAQNAHAGMGPRAAACMNVQVSLLYCITQYGSVSRASVATAATGSPRKGAYARNDWGEYCSGTDRGVGFTLPWVSVRRSACHLWMRVPVKKKAREDVVSTTGSW